MAETREKVVVAMSGGVDSSVAACLLAEQGYEVVGLFMRTGAEEPSSEPKAQATGLPFRDHEGAASKSNVSGTDCPSGATAHDTGLHSAFRIPHSTFAASTGPRAHQGCCSASDAADARFVAGMLGIPFYALNFEKDFDKIIDYFSDEYARGRTPNPCVMCNDKLKFGRLFEYADAVGARFVATGHYARIGRRDGEPVLMRGVDRKKDQSYVLFGLRREMLDRIMFPIGERTKDEVRRIATRYNLPNRDKPDSVEICFVPDRNYARVVRQRRPAAFAPGEVVNTSGAVIGRHEGIANYTIGQRRGLRIAAGRPIYVTKLDVLNNRVVMGEGDALLAGGLTAERVNLLVSGLSGEFHAHVKIRYLHEAVPAKVQLIGGDRAQVTFDGPQRAVTPGQAVVFYDGEAVLGGGWIAAATEIRSQNANDEQPRKPSEIANGQC